MSTSETRQEKGLRRRIGVGVYRLALLVKPADDAPGRWLAYCLDVNLVSEGHSVEEALKSLQDVLSIAFLDDCKRGQNPLTRNAAAPRFWKFFSLIRQTGHKVTYQEIIKPSGPRFVAIEARMALPMLSPNKVASLKPRPNREVWGAAKLPFAA